MEFLITVLAIVACILLFSFAIFIHEFGHFLAAKLLGFQVDTFSIGFGPALWKKTIKGVEYRISAIPFGGYVALPQLDPAGTAGVQGSQTEGDGDKKDGDAVPVAPMANWKKIVVAFAGPFGNIVLAVVLAFVLSCASGARFGKLSAEIGDLVEDGPAAKAGMRVGDVVVSVNGNAVKTWPDRLPAERERLDLAALSALTFRAPDETRFPALRLVKEAARAGGTKTAALSAADEVAVARFLAGEIRYTDIVRLVEAAVDAAPDLPCDSIENILAADAAGRKLAKEWNS